MQARIWSWLLVGRSLASDGSGAVNLYTKGLTAAKAGNAGEALAALEQARTLAPTWSLLPTVLGSVHSTLLGDLGAAEVMYHLALELEPSDGRARQLQDSLWTQHNEAAKRLEQSGRGGEAVAAFAHVVRLTPTSGRAYGRLATALQAQGQHDAAAQHYRVAVELSPDDFIAHFNLGVALRTRKQPDDAAVAFLAAHRADPAHTLNAAFEAAVVLSRAGKLEQAEAAYREASRGDDHRPAFNLGQLQRKLGRSDEAAIQFETAIALHPTFADAYTMLRTVNGANLTTTCDADAPLVVRHRAALPPASFDELRRHVLHHPWLQSANRLSSSFEGTRGFVVRFNRDGARRGDPMGWEGGEAGAWGGKVAGKGRGVGRW